MGSQRRGRSHRHGSVHTPWLFACHSWTGWLCGRCPVAGILESPLGVVDRGIEGKEVAGLHVLFRKTMAHGVCLLLRSKTGCRNDVAEGSSRVGNGWKDRK